MCLLCSIKKKLKTEKNMLSVEHSQTLLLREYIIFMDRKYITCSHSRMTAHWFLIIQSILDLMKPWILFYIHFFKYLLYLYYSTVLINFTDITFLNAFIKQDIRQYFHRIYIFSKRKDTDHEFFVHHMEWTTSSL